MAIDEHISLRSTLNAMAVELYALFGHSQAACANCKDITVWVVASRRQKLLTGMIDLDTPLSARRREVTRRCCL